MNLHPNAELWLKNGERCPAAETIFTHCTGVDVLSDRGEDLPRTLEDLRRCRLLFETVPELRSCLPRVAHLSREWAEIVNFWDDLCLLQDVEAPDWREHSGPWRAPQTKAMLDQFIGRDAAE